MPIKPAAILDMDIIRTTTLVTIMPATIAMLAITTTVATTTMAATTAVATTTMVVTTTTIVLAILRIPGVEIKAPSLEATTVEEAIGAVTMEVTVMGTSPATIVAEADDMLELLA